MRPCGLFIVDSFLQMPHALEVGLPNACTSGVPLVNRITIAVEDVDVGVLGAGQRADLHPGNQFARDLIVPLDLVIQLGGVSCDKKDIPTVRLGHVAAV